MSEQVIDNQLQEMEAPKQVKDKVNASAKPADAMQKMADPGTGLGAIQDLGGPTPQNYKSTDDSSKLKGASGSQSKTAVNAKAGKAEAMPTANKKGMSYENIDFSDDVDALVGTEELSEDFKEKAKTIFEAALVSKVNAIQEELEEHYAAKFEEELAAAKAQLEEKVEATLQYATEEWAEQNSLAIESGIKSEVAESFMEGLKGLFEEHYVTVPEDKYDAFDTMVEKLDEMEQKLNEQVERNIHLNQEIGTFVKESIITDVARGLTETQKDKFASIVEGVGFESEESYRGKIETLKESYFKSETPVAQSDEQEVLAEEVEQVSSSMDAYLRAVSRFK
ncbi:scaffold prohead core protein [Synechococcus phage S-BM3]|nr:scaffold prohead core protein [Synechococcus phage S-BM3]